MKKKLILFCAFVRSKVSLFSGVIVNEMPVKTASVRRDRQII